jgi:hypothetical protein
MDSGTGLRLRAKEVVHRYGKVKGRYLKGKHWIMARSCSAPVRSATEADQPGRRRNERSRRETKVAINCREPDVQEGGVRQELVPGKSIVPVMYGSPDTSGLKYTIIPGEDTYDIKL